MSDGDDLIDEATICVIEGLTQGLAAWQTTGEKQGTRYNSRKRWTMDINKVLGRNVPSCKVSRVTEMDVRPFCNSDRSLTMDSPSAKLVKL